jgi:hypothetical protein
MKRAGKLRERIFQARLDEAGREVEGAHLPGQVGGIHGDAVAPQARAGQELHEAIGLRGGRVDDLPDVEVETVAHQRHLVGEPDVDGAEGVLEELHHLGALGRGDLDDAVEDRLVHRRRQFRAQRRLAAHHLGDLAQRELRVGRVDALRREGDGEFDAHPLDSSIGTKSSWVVPG